MPDGANSLQIRFIGGQNSKGMRVMMDSFPCFDIQQNRIFQTKHDVSEIIHGSVLVRHQSFSVLLVIACLGHSVDGIIPELFQPFCIDLLLFIPQIPARSPRISVNPLTRTRFWRKLVRSSCFPDKSWRAGPCECWYSIRLCTLAKVEFSVTTHPACSDTWRVIPSIRSTPIQVFPSLAVHE